MLGKTLWENMWSCLKPTCFSSLDQVQTLQAWVWLSGTRTCSCSGMKTFHTTVVISWDSPLQEPEPCTHILGRKAEKEEHIKNCLAKRSMKMQERNRSKFLNQILASMLSSSITFTCLYIPKLDVWLLSVKQRAQEILHKRAFSYQILGTSHLPIYLVWTLTNIWAHSNISVEKGNVVITSLQKGNQNIERPRELPKVPLIRLCLSWFQISILRTG